MTEEEAGVLLAENTTLRTEIGVLRAEIEVLMAESRQIRAEAGVLLAENATLRTEIGVLRAEIGVLATEKGELSAENAGLLAEVGSVKEQLQGAVQRIEALEKKKEPPPFVKSNRGADEPKKPRKKRAAEHNKVRRRSAPTRIERHGLERCPECRYRLCGESVAYRREVIELPAPQPVEVIEHQVIKRWCPHCEQWRQPKLDLRGQVIGQGRMGVRVASLVSYLRTTLRLPLRAIPEYLATLHQLTLSVGELAALMHAVGKGLQPQLEELRTAVRTSAVTHADETGWRENGQNGYVWAFVTAGPEAVRYFEWDRSRGHPVAERVLGKERRGCLVTDFYAAYNLIAGPHQRCWVHLLRDLHGLKEEQADNAEVVAWATAVGELYRAGQTWLREQPTPTRAHRHRQYRSLVTEACRLGERYAQEKAHPCTTLAKRLLRHQEELFQFILFEGLPADNNLAERSIRPLVIMRKISGGTRSFQGTQTRMTLASLFHTWSARHLNPFLVCYTTLQRPTAASPP